MRYRVVVPAAGSGRRLASAIPKQYLEVAGRTVIEHALTPFLEDVRCLEIVVAIAADDARWPIVERTLADRRLRSVTGGAERADSVWRGLVALQPAMVADDWVLVHDAARPCLAAAELESLLNELSLHDVGGLLAVPLADTLKRASGDGPRQSVETVDRAGLWRALTPQMFRYGLLREALAAAHAAGRTPTDEAQAIEWAGGAPQLVAGDVRNVKVTTAADLQLVAALLAARNAPPPR